MPRGTALATSDLTRAPFVTLNGQRVVDIQEATLASGERLLTTWNDLEPVVKALVTQVKAFVDQPGLTPRDAARLLGDVATIVHKVGSAATNVLRVSEAMGKLTLLLSAGQTQRKPPEKLTEKQLVATVIETARRIKEQTGACPICTQTVDA